MYIHHEWDFKAPWGNKSYFDITFIIEPKWIIAFRIISKPCGKSEIGFSLFGLHLNFMYRHEMGRR